VEARAGTVPSFFERGFEWGNDSKVETTAAERAIIGRLVGVGGLAFGDMLLPNAPSAAAVGIGSRDHGEATTVGGGSLGFGEAAAVERVIIGRAFSTRNGESLSTT
jgi:hypothetical protein